MLLPDQGDIEQGIAAGGGALHADCEALLLEAGSQQTDVWGADWIPASQEVRYEATIRARVKKVVESLLGGV